MTLKAELIEHIKDFEERDYPAMRQIARITAQARGKKLTDFQKRKKRLIEAVEMLDGKGVKRLEGFMANITGKACGIRHSSAGCLHDVAARRVQRRLQGTGIF